MDVDALYGLPLDRFVPERGALARSLRAAGRREEAEAVALLRKPSVAAWAVNQLVRTQSRSIAKLFDAGDALREAQASLLAGRGDARALRAATSRERAAVDALATAARGLLIATGHQLSPGVIDRVVETAHAAAFDEDARQSVREGRLERELRHVGFGAGGDAIATPVPRPAQRKVSAKNQGAKARGGVVRRRPAGVSSRARAEREPTAEENALAKRAERDREKQRKAARAAVSKALLVADRAARAAQVAQERRERAERALRSADEALAKAHAEAEVAAGAQRRAQDELESL
jgi:hypothetical protein